MELLGLWLGIFVISGCLELGNHFRIVRDAADRGYKIDLERFSDLKGITGLDSSKRIFFSLFIPVINILEVVKRKIKYHFMKDRVFEGLEKAGVLEKMTKKEQQEYQKAPTAMNAFRVNVQNTGVICSVKIQTEAGSSEIFFQINGTFEKIQILKVNGPLATLSPSEQIVELKKAWESILRSGVQKYGDMEHFMDSCRNTSYMDLRKSTSRKTQIKELEAMRSQLIHEETTEIPKQKVKGEK